MIKTTVHLSLLCACLLGLAACDVKKTQEGNVTLPKYDVTPPDVKVGTQEKTVTVPTVKTEEKTVEVPSVKITPAKDK